MEGIKLDPRIIEAHGNIYIVMLLEGAKCPICGKYMMTSGGVHFHGGVFPTALSYNQQTQMQMIGIIAQSKVKVDDEYICVECVAAGKADFLCCLCGKRYPTDQVQESTGDPPVYLCKTCYATVPAQQWDKKTHDLYEAHRWDHE